MIERIDIQGGDEPPEPIAVPKATKPGGAWEHCKVISDFLEVSGLDLRNYSAEGLAQKVFVYCQGDMITQEAIDRAVKWHGALKQLSESTDEIEF